MGRFVFGMILLFIAVILMAVKVILNVRVRKLRKQFDSMTDGYDKGRLKDNLEEAEFAPSILRVAVPVVFGIGLALSAWSTMRIVPANTVGIPTTLGHVGSPMQSGIQFVAPWTEITEFSTRTQELSMLRAPDEGDKKKDDSIEVIAAGGGSMKVDVTVRFSLAPDKAAELFRLAGTLDLVKERFVRPEARTVVRDVFGQYSAQDGYSTKRAEIAIKITDDLKARLATRGILVDTVNVRDVLPEAQVLDSINAILKARNEAAQAAEDQKKQVTEAETRKQVATRDADAKITAANADATAVKIAADAQAQANQKIAASLTPELVDLEKTKACADAISKSGATVINVCGNATANPSGTSSGSTVIVDGRPTK